ncbi:sulfur carrier protein ThiS [Corynebacterium frankenforstense]|uniref:Thiamine biosynthesis protein ThiS n=1 Tax=Corynebacterium frankenforstense DSM 45800 TaxID=1437875 RepID=A0A1L7CTM9_9CORY|nr:sulfur carrier protein ThiS [Corynebacterium frankenforstense]APT89128.1 thiamine biosynthesis protein ThiS [Corynebacterium frankenforstense DSM 45800]MDK6259163.1 sulfur carrier protein ThiS [Corynebacterium frankenforstense]
MIHYTVNDEPREGEPLTVAELVDAEVGTRTGVAVAVDGEVVPASGWDRRINEGERVDVLTAVQGG